jgi:hypothetical protein
MNSIWTRRLTVASVLLVAAVAAVVSYAHMHDLAARSGEQWRAVLIPLSVDGMLVAATLAIVDRRRARHRAGFVPWTGLLLGLAASLAANVAAARPEPVAQLVAAWPPIALAVSIETLVIVLRNTAPTPVVDEPVVGDVPTPDPVNVDEHGLSRAWASAPPIGPALELEAAAEPSSAPTANVDAVARTLIAQGYGKVRLSRELDISQHAARRLIEQHRNGHHQRTPS